MDKSSALLCLLASIIVLQTMAAGQTSNPGQPITKDWKGLRHLKPGREVTVETRDGRIIEAKFADLSDGKLNLSDHFNIISLEPKTIQSVYLTKKSSQNKRAIIGALVGGAVGLLIGSAIGSHLDARARQAPTTGMALAIYSTLGGAAAGYGIGHALAGNRKGKQLYESK